MKKEVLILCKTDLGTDPRVQKQIEALYSDYNLTCVGVKESGHKGVKRELPLFNLDERDKSSNRITQLTKLIAKQYKSLYWTSNNTEVYDALKEEYFDLIICNETEALPIADALASNNNIPIYCDLHEFYLDDRKTGSFSRAQQKYEKWILLNHTAQVNKFTTVSPQIIDVYKSKYNIECELIDNACRYYELSPNLTFDLPIRLVSHGASIPARRLEIMIEAISKLGGNYVLDLYLMNNNPTYRQHLVNMVKGISNVNILESIPFENIQVVINQYDVGLYLLFPTHINNTYALPNKLFEFIQARVAIVTGPTPAMANIVTQYNIGEVTTEFTIESLMESITKMSMDKINEYKRNTNEAASQLNSKKNISQIQKLVADLIN